MYEMAPQPRAARMKKSGGPKILKAATATKMMAAESMAAESMIADEIHEEDFAPPPPPDMVLTSATSSSSSQLLALYTFILPDNVYIQSNGRSEGNVMNGKNYNKQRNKQRLLIDKLQVGVRVFTYAVPSLDSKGYLRAVGQYANSQPYSLVGSNAVRIFLHDSYSGSTNMETTLPGQDIKLNLGKDNNLMISGKQIVPHNQGKEEDQGWFLSDKKKYHVKQEEYVFNAKSNHNSSHLIIVAENLPKSTEKDISIELLIPDKNDLNDLPPSYSMAVRQQFSNILEKSNSDTTYNFIVSAKKICPDISQKKFTKPSCN